MPILKKSVLLFLLVPFLSSSQSFYLGESNSGSGSGNLYSIDATSCALTTIGAMGRSVSGLAIDANGNTFASESTGGGSSNLLSINTTTGAASVIGLLDDGSSIHGSMPDITFRNGVLYGWSELNDTVVTINTSTGAVTDLGNGINSAGSGLATNSTGTMYVIPCAGCGNFTMGVADDSDLHTVDPTTGVVTQVSDLIDNTTDGNIELSNTTIAAMTFDDADNLWGFAGAFVGGGSLSNELISINTTTGELLTICSGLPDGIDALAFAGLVSPPAIIPSSTQWFQMALILFFVGVAGLFGYRKFA